MEPTRLIAFVELVRGCNNIDCPSFGTVCDYNGQQYMTENTLNEIINDFKQTLKEKNPFEVIDIWAYGCGDSLDHPNLTNILKLLKTSFDKIGKISMAIDCHRNIPNGDWYQYLDKIKIIHKIPVDDSLRLY